MTIGFSKLKVTADLMERSFDEQWRVSLTGVRLKDNEIYGECKLFA